MLNLFPQGKDDILTMNEKAMLSKKEKEKKNLYHWRGILKTDIWKGFRDE